MKVYHIVYEPSFHSLDVHFWLPCNLKCNACYTHYEKLDFGLFDDPIAHIAGKSPTPPPERYYSLDEVISSIKGLTVERTIFMGTEPALDPEMPLLAKALHEEFNSYNIMLTNGLKLADMRYLDEIIFSLKAITPEEHKSYTGVENRRILQNFIMLYQTGKKLQAETVLIPGLIEANEVEKVAQFVASLSPDIPLRIDAYFPVGNNPWRAATRQEVEEAAAIAGRHLNKITCLTLDLKRSGDKPLQIL
jgi:pyruvate formate lyase activating enzyme